MKLKINTKKTINAKNDASYKLLLKRMRWIYRENFNYKDRSWREFCEDHGLYYAAKKYKDLALDDRDILAILKGHAF